MASREVSVVGDMLRVEDTSDSVLFRYFTFEERANVTKKSCRWIRDQGGDNSYFILKISTKDSSSLYVLPVRGSDFQRLVTTEDEFEPFCIQGGNYVAVIIEKKDEVKQVPMRESFQNLMKLRFKSHSNGFTVCPLGEKPVEITCILERVGHDGSSKAELIVRYDFGKLVLKSALAFTPEGQGFPCIPMGNEWEFTTNLVSPVTLIDWNFIRFVPAN